MLLVAVSATAVLVPVAQAPPRGRLPLASVDTDISAAKASLLATLPCETFPLPDEVTACVDELMRESSVPAGPLELRAGRYRLLACEPMAEALESACPRKSWYRGWLSRTTEVRVGDDDSETRQLTLELELDIMMAVTGLRFDGQLELAGAGFKLKLSNGEFFEPCAEFGISKSIAKAEEVLRPQFPDSVVRPYRLLFADDDLCILRDETQEGLVVLSQLAERKEVIQDDGSDEWESFIDRGGYKLG